MQTKVWAVTQSPPCIADFAVGGTLLKSMKSGSDFMVLLKVCMPRLRNWRLLGTSFPTASRPDQLPPPPLLSNDFIKLHGGDNHEHAAAHRARFPDGRVGSHSALGMAEHGRDLIESAAEAAAKDYSDFLNGSE